MYEPLTILGIPVLDDNGVPIVVQEMEIKSVPPLLEKPRLVIIHDTDADGICAAWSINKGFKDEYSKVLLIPQRAGVNTIPNGLTEYDSVYLVDRTYPWETLLLLSQQVFCVTVLDHHKSAMSDYVTFTKDSLIDAHTFKLTDSSLYFEYGNITVSIDTTHAACMLAHLWVLEHGVDPDTDISTPWFINYIEDRDLWTWKLKDSKDINAGIHFHGNTFENYDGWYEWQTYDSDLFISLMDGMSNIGNVVTKTQLSIIKGIAHGPTVKSFMGRFPHYHPKALGDNCSLFIYSAVCCPFSLISDLGNYMLNCTEEGFTTPDIVLCYNEVDDGYIYSIRSKEDMIWLAHKYGGGGHPRACGFKSTLSPAGIAYELRSI